MIEDSVPQEFDIGAKVNVDKSAYSDSNNPKKPKGAAGGFVVNQYIYANTTDYAKQQKEAERRLKQVARAVMA